MLPEPELVGAEAVELPAALLKGKLHGAVAPAAVCGPNLGSIPLRNEPLSAAMHRGHPLAREQSVRLAELRDLPIISLRRDLNPDYHERLLALASLHGLSFGIIYEARNFHECLEFAGQDLGIAFLPAYMRTRCHSPTAVFRRIEGGSLYLSHSFIYRPEEKSAALDRLIEIIGHSAGTHQVIPETG
jgi:DNA-binding transcriptional LysR family regulator